MGAPTIRRFPPLSKPARRRLRAARKAAAMTVHELAAVSGWSASLLGYLESGERGANPRVVADVEQALGLPRGVLMPEVKVFRATRVGPHVVGRCYLSGWHVEEVAA